VSYQERKSIEAHVGIVLIDGVYHGNTQGDGPHGATKGCHSSRLGLIGKGKAKRIPGHSHQGDHEEELEEDHKKYVAQTCVALSRFKGLAKDSVDNEYKTVFLSLLEAILVLGSKRDDRRGKLLQQLAYGQRQYDSERELVENINDCDIGRGSQVSQDESRTEEDSENVSKS
jgi:hypothetical protein